MKLSILALASALSLASCQTDSAHAFGSVWYGGTTQSIPLDARCTTLAGELTRSLGSLLIPRPQPGYLTECHLFEYENCSGPFVILRVSQPDLFNTFGLIGRRTTTIRCFVD
ncbi:hypothetical protein BDW59DRAFT_164186 [Aspergillus cavernicola]|uniref:Beta/gamma crystallin 'Greek key' domain-containing protein n=1 Tax=Aspergillus cavernicola TaxID=176166 RepID=A0ABR4I119_9EURO